MALRHSPQSPSPAMVSNLVISGSAAMTFSHAAETAFSKRAKSEAEQSEMSISPKSNLIHIEYVRATGEAPLFTGAGEEVSLVSGAAPGSMVVMYVHPGAEAGESISCRIRFGENLSPSLGRSRQVREKPGRLSEVCQKRRYLAPLYRSALFLGIEICLP